MRRRRCEQVDAPRAPRCHPPSRRPPPFGTTTTCAGLGEAGREQLVAVARLGHATTAARRSPAASRRTRNGGRPVSIVPGVMNPRNVSVSWQVTMVRPARQRQREMRVAVIDDVEHVAAARRPEERPPVQPEAVEDAIGRAARAVRAAPDTPDHRHQAGTHQPRRHGPRAVGAATRGPAPRRRGPCSASSPRACRRARRREAAVRLESRSPAAARQRGVRRLRAMNQACVPRCGGSDDTGEDTTASSTNAVRYRRAAPSS